MADLTYDQRNTLMGNASFIGRVKVAALVYAQNLLTQTNPLATGAETRWAGQVMQQPVIWGNQLANPTVMDPNILAAGIDPNTGDSLADDNTLQGAVEAVANRMM